MKVWKLASRYIGNGFLKIRNGFIIGGAIIGFAFMDGADALIYPLVFGGLFLFFSILFYIIFELPKEKHSQKSVDEFDEIRLLLEERKDALTPIILSILNILENFTKEQQARFTVISNYMCDIIEFERIVPELVISYRKAFDYIGNKDHRIEIELAELKKKVEGAMNEEIRDTYNKALAQKELAAVTMKKIRENMEQTESNLYFILSALEKIESLIKSSEFIENPQMKDTEKISEQFEVFSQSIKDMSQNIRL